MAVTALMLSFLAVGVFAAQSASAQYNPTNCGFIVTPSSVTAGQTVTVTGQGFPKGQTVTFTINGVPIGNATASDDSIGAISTSLTIPATLASGTYSISVDCAGVISSQSISVSGATANAGTAGSGSTSGSLAGTGADPMPFVKAALMLLVVGGMIVLATKRREHADA